jgi:hypothetical protein
MFRPGKAAVEAWAYSTLKQLGIPTLDRDERNLHHGLAASA